VKKREVEKGTSYAWEKVVTYALGLIETHVLSGTVYT